MWKWRVDRINVPDGCLIKTSFYSSSYPDLKNLVVAAQYQYVQIHLADGASPTY